MSLIVSNIVEVSMNKISVHVDDLTAERAIIASNGAKTICPQISPTNEFDD